MLSVLMLQLPVPNNPGANIPLAAGYLKAWAHEQGLLERVAIEIMPRAIADRAGDALLVGEIVRRRPDVLGISLYTWNSERSLLIAELARQRLPDLTVVVGGPEVQRNNEWVLHHPAVDIAVEGEGEQTFLEILAEMTGSGAADTPADRAWPDGPFSPQRDVIPLIPLAASQALTLESTRPLIAGTIVRQGDELLVAPARASLPNLDVVPSPYLLGFLELRAGEIALVECSRWCPYGCTFCLYGRNMGAKLGGRLFGAERILAEVAWAAERGAGAIHFVEANLNLLPIFRELMAGLREINSDPATPVYAELRGEHLKDEVVDALVAAGLHTAEVGLQSANRSALQAVGRRTDLEKWAEGTRRLYARGVQVLLDVILGLPEDDRDSTLATIDWIAEQQLGPYDVFTLQVLPGTGVRTDAARFAMTYQDRPPYYVLGTRQLSYAELRGLRWELREAAGLDPQAVEGLPEPSIADWQRAADSGQPDHSQPFAAHGWPIDRLELDCAAPLSPAEWRAHGAELAEQAASHMVVIARNPDLAVLEALCWPIAAANPSIHWDIVLDSPPIAARSLRELGARWPHMIGYLDRIAVYRRPQPEPAWSQVTPRWWVIAGWESAGDPLQFEGIADLVWRVTADQADAALRELEFRGGSGMLLAGPAATDVAARFVERDIRVFNY
jgi:radical SAM superfamily enzyme YgiQ (UPF0313 family)